MKIIFTALLIFIPLCAAASQQSKIKRRILYVDQLIEKANTGHWDKLIIRALLWEESPGWRQFDGDGNVFRCGDDFGIGQINLWTILDHPNWNFYKLCTDTKYNIECSAQVLTEKRDMVRRWRNNPKKMEQLHREYGVLGLTEFDLTLLAYNAIRRDKRYKQEVKELMIRRPWQDYMLEVKNGK